MRPAREPGISGPDLGRRMTGLSLNLIVRDVERSLGFWCDVLGAEVIRADRDLAALAVAGATILLHADHTHASSAWAPELAAGVRRGLGAEIRLLGIDPDAAERRARERGHRVLKPTAERAHGWRDVILEDPDGYGVAVGVPLP